MPTILANIKQIGSTAWVQMIYMDGGSESLRSDLAELGMFLNTVSRDEHVPNVRRTCTIN